MSSQCPEIVRLVDIKLNRKSRLLGQPDASRGTRGDASPPDFHPGRSEVHILSSQCLEIVRLVDMKLSSKSRLLHIRSA